MDARHFDPRAPAAQNAIRKPLRFSPFRFLALLLPAAVCCWYWAHQALHQLELQWVREHPAQWQSLAAACQASADALCRLQPPLALLHAVALGLLLFLPKFMLLTASLPRWPSRWQQTILRHAKWFGALGLLITLAMVIVRGIAVTMVAWLMPLVWLGNDTMGAQVAAVIGLVAIMRVGPHAKTIWQLVTRLARRRSGKPVSRTECAALWALIDDVSRRLVVDSPQHLVLGVAPDCRLEIGQMTLDPTGQVVEGRILYLGATLVTALDQAGLQLLIEQALLRSRGALGAWLPAVEDWVEASQGFLDECKMRERPRGPMATASDPAMLCWEGWLIMVRKMLASFKDEHAYLQKKGIESEVERDAPIAAALLSDAALAYRKDVFHLFIVNLTSGVHCPAVLRWFGRAFAQRRGAAQPGTGGNAHAYTSAALEEELVLLEKEWLIRTSQASTPTDCWELRAA